MANLPFSAFRQIGNTYYIAGQIGLKDGKLVSDDFKEQTIQAVANLAEILKQNGMTIENVVDVTAFITEEVDLTTFNEVYGNEFKSPYPARATVTVKALPFGAKVELKAIASI